MAYQIGDYSMTIKLSDLGGGGSVIKSIQRGVSNSGSSFITITISEINPLKTSLNLLSQFTSGSAYMTLESSTTILVIRPNNQQVSWEVIEYV